MLVPLTREKFDQLLPVIASGPQYKYYCGKFSDVLQRLLISVVCVAIVLLIRYFLALDFGPILFLIGLFGGFYWLWGPVFWASIRNAKCRRYKYSGFFRGRILDWWITDETIGKQETVNNKGELVIVENREKCLNLEIGDNTGFTTQIKAPLKPNHKVINRGQVVEMVVMSNRPDLSRIEEISDVYIPNRDIWVSDYPYLRRDFFPEVSRRIRQQEGKKETRDRKIEEEYDPRNREDRPQRRSQPPRRRYSDEGNRNRWSQE
ncbi:hypothetical protein [Calothrix sp. 336/3]|uniref:hypothetical protein n=1 Tax=Calothrix sp. 336/3 TaxID=1337936 RepID=UPI0004E41463|nr:hypothetical protein [Calothrix sp. 336/3]AKG22820.1 ABC-type phosphate transport system, permease component [Calothrix sp. 336/3]